MDGNSTVAAKSIIATIIGVAGYIKGSFNELFVVLAIFMVCDYVSGTALALVKGEFSVKKGLLGAMKKLLYLFVILMGFSLDLLISVAGERMGLSLATNGVFGLAINCYLIGTEGLSIIKSLTALGLPVPKFMKKAMGLIKKSGEKIGEQTDAENTEK